MKVAFVIAIALIATVFSADPDPTKICLPDVFETVLYNFNTETAGIAYVDFTKELLAIHYSDHVRSVFNLTDFSGFIVNETTNACHKLKAADTISNVVTKCLPSTAVLLTNQTSFIGLNPGGVEIQAWLIDIPTIATVRVALTKTTPPFPVVREYRAVGSSQPDVVLFVNPKLTIEDPTAFSEPAVCTSDSVVG